jgi:G3E family GTPase
LPIAISQLLIAQFSIFNIQLKGGLYNMPSDSQREEKIKIILLSGFLGSGKTTLLQRILSWEADLSDTVVLMNEFGEVGIDGSLLRGLGTDVVELTNGCICCTLSIDLNLSLKGVLEQFKPRQILMEGSGVADPTAIADCLKDPALQQHMEIHKILTVLDVDVWEAREVFGPLFYNQLEMADLILMNKIDLLSKDQIPQYLKEVHDLLPDAQVIPTIRCRIDPETLWTKTNRKNFGLKPIQFFREASLDGTAGHGSPAEHHHHDHDSEAGHDQNRKSVDASNYVAFSFQNSQALDETRFKQFVADLPWELFRMKGPVRFQDRTELINFVGGKSEWVFWDGDPETRLAFIGWDVDREVTLRKLSNCIIR